MIAAFIVLAIVIALALLGTYLSSNPAMIHVIFESGTRIEWPLWLFAVRAVEVLIVLLIVIKIIWTIIRLPAISKRFGRNHRANKAGQLLQKGMLAMGKGKWKQAEKLLAKGARLSQAANQDASLFLSAAAQAAQHQGATERRDEYLVEARQMAVEGKDTFTAAIAEAKLHIENKTPKQALAALQKHHTSHFDNELLLQLESDAHAQLDDYGKVWHLLKGLKKTFPSKAAYLARQGEIAKALFASMNSSIVDIERVWSDLSRAQKSDEHMVLAYVSALIHSSEKEKAASVLTKEIRNTYSDVLISAYSQFEVGSSRDRLRSYVNWLNARPENAALNFGAAKSSFECEEFDKAKDYAERSVKIDPQPEALALLGKIYEMLGQENNALQAYRTSVGLTYQATNAVSGEVLSAPEGAQLLTDASSKDATSEKVTTAKKTAK